MGLAALVLPLLLTAAEPAVEPSAPPPPPSDAPTVRTLPKPSCWEVSTGQHYAVQYYGPGMDLNVGAPAPPIPQGSPGAASNAEAPLTGNGSSIGRISGEALLALAVVVVAAAPIVVYALDSPASPDVMARYRCPQVDVAFVGGAVSMPSDPSRFAPIGGVRTAFSMGLLGVDASYESTFGRDEVGNLDVHLRLRPPPREHIEGAVAVGYRRAVFGGAQRDGFELGLPHHYVLTRLGVRPVTIDLHPAVFIGSRGPDFRLEAGFTFPAGIAAFQVGGRVFSFDTHVRAGAHLGFGLNI